LLNDWPFVENPDFSFLKGIELKDKIDSLAYKVAVENTNWEKAHSEAAGYYLSKKDYQNFAKEMHVVVSQYPFKLEDYDFAASQLINAKEYDLAFSFLTKRYKEAQDAFTTKWLGNIYLNKGKVEDAIKYLLESIDHNNSDAQVFYNLAGAYINKKDYGRALEAIKNCIRINADFPNARYLETQLATLINQ
jgi:tetratricopeptide (TPR) repeat protein